MLSIETGPPEEQPVLLIARQATSPAPPSAFLLLSKDDFSWPPDLFSSKALFFKLLSSSYLTLPHCFLPSSVETNSDLFCKNEKKKKKKPFHQLPLTLLLLYIL